jgi:hypothetical protein
MQDLIRLRTRSQPLGDRADVYCRRRTLRTGTSASEHPQLHPPPGRGCRSLVRSSTNRNAVPDTGLLCLAAPVALREDPTRGRRVGPSAEGGLEEFDESSPAAHQRLACEVSSRLYTQASFRRRGRKRLVRDASNASNSSRDSGSGHPTFKHDRYRQTPTRYPACHEHDHKYLNSTRVGQGETERRRSSDRSGDAFLPAWLGSH